MRLLCDSRMPELQTPFVVVFRECGWQFIERYVGGIRVVREHGSETVTQTGEVSHEVMNHMDKSFG